MRDLDKWLVEAIVFASEKFDKPFNGEIMSDAIVFELIWLGQDGHRWLKLDRNIQIKLVKAKINGIVRRKNSILVKQGVGKHAKFINKKIFAQSA